MTSFFKLACPQCNKPLKVSHDLAGQTRKCPYCHSGVKIPDAVAPPPEAAGEAFPNIVVTPTAAPAASETAPTAPPSTAAPARRKKSWFHAGSGDSASSDVSLFVSGAMGAGMAAVWLVAMLPLRGYQMGQLFWDRGLIPFATTFLMFWSVGMLILKWLNLKQQKEAMLLDVLPTEVAEEITLDSLNNFVKHINSLPVGGSESFLINRVLRGIEHFRVRKSAAETVTMMESQSAIDANNVAGSYTLLKAFIWALPILGFIGTVVGVSAAVASLASSLDSASDMTAMKGA
ncbi:MAG: MotA/TolQ/ExbB proton channel family protein, partial [Planctomycetota bacterium]